MSVKFQHVFPFLVRKTVSDVTINTMAARDVNNFLTMRFWARGSDWLYHRSYTYNICVYVFQFLSLAQNKFIQGCRSVISWNVSLEISGRFEVVVHVCRCGANVWTRRNLFPVRGAVGCYLGACTCAWYYIGGIQRLLCKDISSLQFRAAAHLCLWEG